MFVSYFFLRQGITPVRISVALSTVVVSVVGTSGDGAHNSTAFGALRKPCNMCRYSCARNLHMLAGPVSSVGRVADYCISPVCVTNPKIGGSNPAPGN